jgi:hypothetical protein
VVKNMKNSIHRNDLFRASIFIPLLRSIPAELITTNQAYAKILSSLPEWLTPASIGFALAVWIVDPWTKDSRIKQLWKLLSDTFSVEQLHAQSMWSDWDGIGKNMPETDLGVRLRIRFIRTCTCNLNLRIYSGTGRSLNARVDIVKLGQKKVVSGDVMDIPLVYIGIPEPGWDHLRKRGWGPEKSVSFIFGGGNVAILECRRLFFVQKHRFFIEAISHIGKHSSPRLYVQDEDVDVFDTWPQ